MQRNKEDDKEFVRIAGRYNIKASEVRKIVASFFDILQIESRRLPFDNPARIFSRDKFKEFVTVYHIPFIGRLGPVYSRYLLWRKNESELLTQAPKSSIKKKTKAQAAERIAESILSGSPMDCGAEKTNYNRVWIVGTSGKKLAKQVIQVIEDKNV